MGTPTGRDAELLFGTIAVRNGIATPEQVEECVRLQAEARGRGEDRTLGQVLIERGYATEDDIRDVLRAQGYARVRMQDMFFGRLVLRNELATPEQVMVCLDEQRKALESDGKVEKIGDIFQQHGVLTGDEVQAILTIQERMRSKGLHQPSGRLPAVSDGLPVPKTLEEWPGEDEGEEDEEVEGEEGEEKGGLGNGQGQGQEMAGTEAPVSEAASSSRWQRWVIVVLILLVAAVGTLFGLAEYHLRKGHKLMLEGNYADAEAHYLAPRGFGMGTSACFLYAGRAARAQGLLDRAEDLLFEGTRRMPSLCEVHTELAEVLWELDSPHAAHAAVDEALGRWPANARANYTKGVFLLYEGDKLGARPYLQAASQTAKDPDLKFLLDKLLADLAASEAGPK